MDVVYLQYAIHYPVSTVACPGDTLNTCHRSLAQGSLSRKCTSKAKSFPPLAIALHSTDELVKLKPVLFLLSHSRRSLSQTHTPSVPVARIYRATHTGGISYSPFHFLFEGGAILTVVLVFVCMERGSRTQYFQRVLYELHHDSWERRTTEGLPSLRASRADNNILRHSVGPEISGMPVHKKGRVIVTSDTVYPSRDDD